ncbi:MAG: beta-ketoacyl synthase N-terminal-like domain-containing protein [bacterium]
MPFFAADNIITALGLTTPDNWSELLKGQTGIRTISDPALYKEPFQAALVDHDVVYEKFSGFDDPENYTQLEKMIILSIREALEQTQVDPGSPRTGLILSTTKGNIDLLGAETNENFPPERVTLWKMGEVIARQIGHHGMPIVLSNACISGVLAINLGAMMVHTGRYDNIIISGGDLVSRFVVSGFMSFLSLSPQPCRPFDAHRDGLSLGEAAGTLILSKEKTGRDDILWLGGATANDANHISGPSRTGEGSYIAIREAFAEAGVSKDEIDHIGAAGIVETAILLLEMKRSTVIRSAGYGQLGVSKPIRVAAENVNANLNTCLKMASGFGGSNAAMVIEKV